MAQFKAFTPNVEVNGETVYSIVDGMGAFKQQALQILAESGISNPKPGAWYSQQAWLNAFKTIAEKVGSQTLFLIGQKIPENAQFPPQIDSVEKALPAIDLAYHMNHRGGEIGHYNYEKTDATSATMVCANPYPCDFDRGIILAMARKFKPSGSFPSVVHDDAAPCRKKGGDSCTYHIKW